MTGTLEHAPLAPIIEAFADQLAPPPNRYADQWADANRILPEGTARPGKWRTDFVPWTRAIYRALHVDSPYRTVVIAMGSQMSKTELILNVIGHRFDDGPYMPALYIGPTQKQVSSMSRERFATMIATTPALNRKLAKGQDDKITEKFIGGVRLGFAWAGSATELASHPAGLVFVDERDRMKSDVGGEGDPVALARGRMKTFQSRAKLGIVSTPTIEGASPIWTLYEEGTMMKWSWPCRHCNAWFTPGINLLKYDKDAPLAEIEEMACIVCPECGSQHVESDKHALNQAGDYLPHRLEKNGDHKRIAEPIKSSTASFWASGLASWQEWGIAASLLAAAYRSNDPDTIQGVINVEFGELYKLKGSAPEYGQVLALKTPAKPGSVPSWARLVTMGSDVQKDGIFYTIRAWGPDNLSQLIRHGFIAGNTAADDVWLQWMNVLNQMHEGRYLIDRCFVDSGYNPGRDRFKRPEHKVYNMCRRTQLRAMPSKGYSEREKPLEVTRVDVNAAGRTIVGGVMLWRINTDYYKSWLHAQIDLEDGVAPNWLLHAGVDVDYCKQIVAEELVIKPSGKRIWVCPAHRPNHFLDCEVLAKAAADSLQAETIGEEFVAPQNADDDDDQEFINLDDDVDFFARYD